MTWGPISAAASEPHDIEKVLNETAQAFFDNLDMSDEAREGGLAQAKAASAAARVMAENLEYRGAVNVSVSGHFGDHNVPSAISMSLVDLNPPDPPVEPEDRENAIVE